MVDYSKWSSFNDDDETMSRRFEEVSKEDILEAVKDPLLGRFVSIQKHDEGRPCNIERHEFIIRFLEQEPVLHEKVETLCRVAQERFEEHDNRLGLLFLEAVNTLEACRRFGALELYSKICAPRDETSRALREEYAKQTFGKLRLKRFMYKKLTKEDPGLLEILEENEARELSSIFPIAPTKPSSSSYTGLVVVATILVGLSLLLGGARVLLM